MTFYKDERGSAELIEMALVYPIVLLVILFIAFLGYYGFESAALYSTSERLAVLLAKEASMDGYELLWQNGGLTTKTDFDWPDHYMPGKELINSIFQKQDLYKYWQTFDVDQDALDIADKLIWQNKLISILRPCENATTSYSLLTNPSELRIYVSVSKKANLPLFFRFIRIDTLFDIEIETVAVVNDPSFFVRNADLVLTLSSDYWQTLHINSNEASIERRSTLLRERLLQSNQRIGANK